MRCSKVGCKREGAFRVVLVLAMDPEGEQAALGDLDVCFCVEHRKNITLDEVLAEVAWRRIEEAFVAVGRPAPSRVRAKLSFEPLS